MAEIVITPDDLLARAKVFIDQGEEAYRAAAENIAAARDRGKSQREIADAVGKSAAWVNQLLKWQREGFKETPFGPQSRASRQRERPAVQAPERAIGARREDQFAETDNGAASENVGPNAEDEFFEGCVGDSASKFDGRTRKRLVALLGKLGSDSESERSSAATMIEKHRRKVRMMWDDLIVPADPN
jgi:hypothetical protein